MKEHANHHQLKLKVKGRSHKHHHSISHRHRSGMCQGSDVWNLKSILSITATLGIFLYCCLLWDHYSGNGPKLPAADEKLKERVDLPSFEVLPRPDLLPFARPKGENTTRQDRMLEYHRNLSLWIKPHFSKAKVKFDVLSLISQSDRNSDFSPAYKIQEALKALQAQKKNSHVFPTKSGSHTLYEFDYSKSWMFYGAKGNSTEKMGATKKIMDLISDQNEFCDSVLENKVGLMPSKQENEYFTKYLQKHQVSSLMQFGGTGILTLLALEDVELIFSAERDRPTCFGTANCLWALQLPRPVEFYYQCETRESTGALSAYAQFKDFVDVMDRIPHQEKLRQVDLVLISGVAQFSSALRALQYTGPNTVLFIFKPSFSDAKVKGFFGYYFSRKDTIGSLEVFVPKPEFIGKDFSKKDIHFLHFISYKSYKSGSFELSTRGAKKRKSGKKS